MYAQHLRKWSLKTKKQLMPLILLIISNMLLYPTMIVAGATATEQHQQQQQQQQRLWEGSAEESSYYIPLSLDNGSRESSSSISGSSSSSSSSSSNIDNNILSRLLSHTSNSLSSRSNLKLMPATVFDAPEQHVAAVPQQQQQQQQQQSMQKVPNTLINSQLYKLLNNGKSSEAASSKMRRHIEPTHLQHQLQLQQQQQQLQHLQQAGASNYSRRAVPSYFIESYEVPDSPAEQAVRSRRDGGNQQRQHPRIRQQQDKREHRRQRQQQRHHQPHNHHHKQKQQQQQRRKQHQRKHRGRQGSGRYCSARDPAQLAFAAPTVFEGVFKSMSADRRVNFSATMKVLKVYKQQRDLQLPQLVRLQFALRNTSGECDIYRERLLPRGLLRSGNDLQQASDISYMMFVQQTNPGNFTILGQPVRVTNSVLEAVEMAVSPNYAQNASITSITSVPSNSTIKHGQELKIICKVTGQPPPKVTWFKDDRSINRKRNVYQFKHHKRRSELIVSSFNSSSDAGKYECRAKNKASKAIIKRRIMINAEPVIVRAEPPSMGVPCENIDYCFHNGTCTFLPDLGEYFCNCANNFFGGRCENSMPDSRYFVAIYGQIHTLNNDY
ncbi:vein, isoform A [Drosophila ananassae]|uniref:Vein, isoform A n=1 Tax=Drosophila ananassae TaxID=7217 RepID=B3M3L4_DROAN|nr:protein vein isoform X2 [Drosophila ananassae]EDV40307.1 vein, isoform A [Drosophila ananassae]